MTITRWSRPIRRALIGTLCATAVVVAGVALYVYLERVRTLEEGRAAAGRLAHVLEEQAARAFHGVDLTLLGIGDAMAVAPRLEANNPAFEDALRRRLAHLPFVRGLFVVGADGFVVQETNQPRSPRISLADRAYFRVHVEAPEAGLYISAPLMSRVVGRWFISASRRIDGPGGRLAGVAVAAVEPAYFEHLYDTLHLGEGDAIALLKTDGTLLFRSPYPEGAIGKSFADREVIRRSVQDRSGGTFRARSSIDGVRRIVSYRVVEGLPLVVAVGLAERPLLAGWRRLAVTALTGTVVAVALAATVSLLLMRQVRQRRELQERLAHARGLEDLGRMTGGIAHDFNNVLNVIATNLETIRRRAATERLPVSVDPAMRAVEQGTKLVSQLLAFARRQELTVRPLDTNRVVQALMPMLTQATGPRVVIRTDLADGVWACLADEAQLNSALLNLVVNARDAMPDGQGVIRITTRNYTLDRQPSAPDLSAGDYVRVTVTDNGTGMPASIVRRATEPLFTTKGEGMGAGLGLSQVYGFARQVGGDLVIESTVGVGTSVHLVLRRAPGTTGTGGPEDDRLRDERSRRSPGGLRAGSP
jgi:signal transduction histidine kinase